MLPNGQSRPRPKPVKIGQNSELRDFIQDRLTRRWSPEQICHALRRSFYDRPEMHRSPLDSPLAAGSAADFTTGQASSYRSRSPCGL
ncbi:hypothetical protein GCM10009654_65240 [Streptomyces hebeiensis]|uniref:Transposase n=1 Tax=Streptomyces hebeiensis TaxID=229486 RepID=A0ABP4FT67_9ACTN